MKTPLIPIVLLIGATCASCEVKYPFRLTLDIVDDAGQKVEGAQVKTAVFDYWLPGESFGKEYAKTLNAVSDKNGAAILAATTSRCEFIMYTSKPGHYDSNASFKSRTHDKGRWDPWNPTIPVELKRVLKPIPLVAKKVAKGYGEYVLLPADQASYDLEVGDWVAPHGTGMTADLVFHIQNKTADGYAEYSTLLTLSFSNPQDGLVMLARPKGQISTLIMPYQAPSEGYLSHKKWRKQRTNSKVINGKYLDGNTTDETKPDEDYFLRLRTKLNEKGEIVSANYAKVQGSFLWWPNGLIQFQYHFNPTPNDRNLEFDPAKNLLKVDKWQEVTEP